MNKNSGKLRDQQYAFAAHLRDPGQNPAPEDIEERRMQIYRDLFFNNVRQFLANSFPVLSGLLGDARWRLLIRDYYRDHRSRSPLFPDMPKEFLDYLENERAARVRSDTEPDPPFLYELAHYEWVETGLSLAQDPAPDPAVNPDGDLLDGQPALSSLAWLLSYSYPVDRINVDNQPDAPAAEPLHFIVYRDADNKVRFLKINIVSARLFELLRPEAGRNLNGKAALGRIAEELGHPDASKVVAAGQRILAEWRSRGIVTGSREPDI
jgi:hypothetical protein